MLKIDNIKFAGLQELAFSLINMGIDSRLMGMTDTAVTGNSHGYPILSMSHKDIGVLIVRLLDNFVHSEPDANCNNDHEELLSMLTYEFLIEHIDIDIDDNIRVEWDMDLCPGREMTIMPVGEFPNWLADRPHFDYDERDTLYYNLWLKDDENVDD